MVYWTGGEDIDFPNGATPTYYAYHRAAFSRAAMCGNGSLPVKGETFSPQTSLWLSFWSSPYAAYGPGYVGLGNSGSDSGLFVSTDAGDSTKITLVKRDAGVLTVLATGPTGYYTNAPTLHKVDIQVGNYGASGTVNVWVDGFQLISYSGAIAATGVTNLDQVWLWGATASVNASEFVVADQDTRAIQGVLTMAPVAAGTTNTWSNSGFAVVSPIGYDDSNAAYTNTAAQDAQYNLTDQPAIITQVVAVRVVARAMHTAGSTATGVALGFNSGGSVAVAATHALGTGFGTVSDLFAQNPVTSAPWGGATEMNALQVEMRSA